MARPLLFLHLYWSTNTYDTLIMFDAEPRLSD